MQRSWRALTNIVILVLLAVPALAAHNETVINGIDFWYTPAHGGSFADFAREPIPAGFFCDGSRPFKGRIYWQGEPLVTSPAGALGNADTVIHRLDDAAFDENGIASTRIQVKALSLVSTAPLVTSCGSFDVRASLWGEQRITDMHIESLGDGEGYFRAPLALTVRLVFTPLQDSKARPLEIVGRNVEFPATRIRWASEPYNGLGPGRQIDGFVVVDTDGDGRPDLSLPGTSNFFPVRQEEGESVVLCDIAPDTGQCPPDCVCHCSDSGFHCVVPPPPPPSYPPPPQYPQDPPPYPQDPPPYPQDPPPPQDPPCHTQFCLPEF